MEVMEEFAASNDLSMIIKGKRTRRRQRPLSPPVCRPAALTSSSSSGCGEDGGLLGYFCSLNPSSTTSTSDISTTTTTSTDEEDDDQDIANCLILLAQGESGRKKNLSKHHQEDVELKMEKFTSRRFNELASSTNRGKVGCFVYECKTCNRIFPSFQALGGHRASHKKPKIAIEEKKAAIDIHPQEEGEEEHHQEEEEIEQGQTNRPTPNPTNLSVHATNNCLERNNNNVNKSKIHECSLCGAEFSSGQALGGHMRRHRNLLTSTKLAMIVGTSNIHEDEETSQDLKKPRNIFPLDLNLPAPVDQDDHHRDLKFQQPHLVFPAPALVDCHY